MKRITLLPVLTMFIILVPIFSSAPGDNEPADVHVGSCPEVCEESRGSCELSCSQLVGGGAKSEKRRECIRECGGDLQGCKDRCLNPTPRPTLKPAAYYDKSCANACDLKLVDCNVTCTKYVGAGAKSEKRTACRRECAEDSDHCKKWCVNPTERPVINSDPYQDEPCSQACKYKLTDCEGSCSIYIGGGAKGGKRGKCVSDCRGHFEDCSSSCSER